MKTIHELRQLLNRAETRKELEQIGERVGSVWLSRVMDFVAATAAGDFSKFPVRFDDPNIARWVEGLLAESTLFDSLPSPPQVAPIDLVPLFANSFLKSGCPDNLDERATLFTNQLCELALSDFRSDPLVGGRGEFVAVSANAERDSSAQLAIPLLSTESGFEVSIVGCVPAALGGGETAEHTHVVLIQVRAYCTRNAFQAAVAEIVSVLTTLVEGANLLLSLTRADDRRVLLALGGENPWRGEKGQSIGILAEGGHLGREFLFLRECLTTYFVAATRRDSILRRIRNATRLLVQASAQAGNAVGLALSVAATEALLCRKGDNIATVFAENVAALLEPEPRYRPAAVSWAKKLYGLRSDVLHGSGLECTYLDIRNAQVLAIAVLKGMVERRQFVHKMGDGEETPDGLLRELRDDKYTPGQLTGVEESPVKELWRPEAKKT